MRLVRNSKRRYKWKRTKSNWIALTILAHIIYIASKINVLSECGPRRYRVLETAD